MGCWNATCALSHMPIHYGDEVVVILLEPNNLNSTYLYISGCDDIFKPFTYIPIYGKYDDYGGIYDAETFGWNKKFLQSCLSIKANNFESFINKALYSGEFTLDDGNKHIIYPMFIHRKLYDRIMENMGSRIPCGRSESLLECWIKKFSDDVDVYRKLHDFNKSFIHESIFYDALKNGHAARKFYAKEIVNCSEKILHEFIVEIAKSVVFEYALNYMRCGYMTVSGDGSQCDETMLHVIIADFIKEKSEIDCNNYGHNEDGCTYIKSSVYFFD